MKRTSISFWIGLLAGAATALAAPRDAGIEQVVNERSGKRLQWQRDAVSADEIAATIQKLLKQPLTADRAAQVALLGNRELQATIEEIGISQAELREAGLLKNPSLDGMVRFPDRPPSVANLEGGLAQEFLDLLMLPLRKRVAAAAFEATRLRVADEVLKLIADTKTGFYEMQAQAQIIAHERQVLEAAAAALEMRQRQHSAGNIPDLQLAREQVAYNRARLDLASADAEIRVKREKLNRLMGLWGRNTEWRAADLPSMPLARPALGGLESIAIEQRLDLAARKAEVSSLVRSLGLTSTYRFIGALEFGVSSERDTDRQVVTGPTIRLELPIFNQGQARVAKAQAQLRQAERRLEALAVEIRSEVREKRDRLIAHEDAARFYLEEMLPSHRRVVELTQLEYNAMFIGVFDLLEAKQQELDAQRGYVEAARDYWIAHAELERALGGSFSPRRGTSDQKAISPASSQHKPSKTKIHTH